MRWKHMLESLNQYKGMSLFFVRLAVGIVFLVHGVGKLFNVGPTAMGISGFAGFLTSLGVPAASVAAVLVALVETVGGLLILIGLWTRVAALLLAVNMVVAILLVHISKGFSAAGGGYEFALVLFLSSVALVLGGAGEKWAVDKE